MSFFKEELTGIYSKAKREKCIMEVHNRERDLFLGHGPESFRKEMALLVLLFVTNSIGEAVSLAQFVRLKSHLYREIVSLAFSILDLLFRL